MISVIIPANNESDNIQACLDTIAWADEIIIVDSFSTDDTLTKIQQWSIANPSVNVLVKQHVYEGPAAQKNWAIPQAAHEWVLLLDADERVSPELALELKTVSASPLVADAYSLPRHNFFNGKQIRHSGWGNDKVIRLIRRDTGRYPDVQVHEVIDTTHLRVARLNGALLHYTYKSIEHFTAKQKRYAIASAHDHASRTGRITLFHLWLKPAFRFFKHYILQAGFLDGKEGYTISRLMALGVRWRYEELQKTQQTNK